jgi:regulation of enolase protein 1 (concanavalin A-like superfamily)
MNDFFKRGVNLLTQENMLQGFNWLNKPDRYSLENNMLKLTAKANTDFFRPINGLPKDNASFFCCPISGDFTIQTHLNGEFYSSGDAGSLIIRYSPERWAKICVERNGSGEISIVTVVTDGTSDDANSELISGADAYLRITRIGETIGMHYSIDGLKWRFVRKFRFELSVFHTLMIGLQAQSPCGEGCTVTFSLLQISFQVITDFKSGE